MPNVPACSTDANRESAATSRLSRGERPWLCAPARSAKAVESESAPVRSQPIAIPARRSAGANVLSMAMARS